jgi:nitric oxide dioxygenase
MMTPEQITLVQDSFAKVEPIADKAAELFYGRLFEIAPQVKPLFTTPVEEQGKKLMTMIGIAVKGLSKLEQIVPAVQQLGVRHLDYGVEEEHFAIVGEALLWTLEQGLGDAWNDELKDAWSTTYGVLADTMVSAMNEARESAPAV